LKLFPNINVPSKELTLNEVYWSLYLTLFHACSVLQLTTDADLLKTGLDFVLHLKKFETSIVETLHKFPTIISTTSSIYNTKSISYYYMFITNILSFAILLTQYWLKTIPFSRYKKNQQIEEIKMAILSINSNLLKFLESLDINIDAALKDKILPSFNIITEDRQKSEEVQSEITAKLNSSYSISLANLKKLIVTKIQFIKSNK